MKEQGFTVVYSITSFSTEHLFQPCIFISPIKVNHFYFYMVSFRLVVA